MIDVKNFTIEGMKYLNETRFTEIIAAPNLSGYDACRQFCVETSKAFINAELHYSNSILYMFLAGALYGLVMSGTASNIIYKACKDNGLEKVADIIYNMICAAAIILFIGITIYFYLTVH